MYFVLLLVLSCTQLAHQLPLRRSLPPFTEPEGTNQTASATTNSAGGNMTDIDPCNATGNDTLGESSEVDMSRNCTENGSLSEQLCVYNNRTHNIQFDCDCERVNVPPAARWSVLLGLIALKEYSTELYTKRAESFEACLEPVRHHTQGAFLSRPERSHHFVAKWMRVFQSYAGYIASVITQGGVSPSEKEQLVTLYQMLSGILNDYATVVS